MRTLQASGTHNERRRLFWLCTCVKPGRGRSVPPSLGGAIALPAPSERGTGCGHTVDRAGPLARAWMCSASRRACSLRNERCPGAGPSGFGVVRPGCLLPELPPGSPLPGRELVRFHVLRFTPEDPVPVEEIVPNRGESRCSGLAQNIRPAKSIKTGNYHITYDDVQ